MLRLLLHTGTGTCSCRCDQRGHKQWTHTRSHIISYTDCIFLMILCIVVSKATEIMIWSAVGCIYRLGHFSARSVSPLSVGLARCFVGVRRLRSESCNRIRTRTPCANTLTTDQYNGIINATLVARKHLTAAHVVFLCSTLCRVFVSICVAVYSTHINIHKSTHT